MERGIYTLEIKPLTGVSINNGHTLDKASYVIEPGNTCAVVDIDRLVLRVYRSGSSALKHSLKCALDACSRSLDELKAFVEVNFIEDDVVYRTALTKDALRKLRYDKGNLNFNEIYREVSGKERIPVLPGSSIKGAVRTAFLNYAFKRNVLDDHRTKEWEYRIASGDIKGLPNAIDAEILFSKKFVCAKDNIRTGDPKFSAMRGLRISDAHPEGKSDTIVSVFEMLGSLAGKALPLMDVVPGSLLGFDNAFKSSVVIQEIKDSRLSLDSENIIASCNAFSVDAFSKEKEYLYKDFKSYEREKFLIYEKLEDTVCGRRNEGEFVIRLGRFSQREYMTYPDEFRYVSRSSNRYNDKWGSTRTVMYIDGQYIPLGWCLCKLRRKANEG